jgi:tRNA-(ms[2]io[6]A)-hydroxylase
VLHLKLATPAAWADAALADEAALLLDHRHCEAKAAAAATAIARRHGAAHPSLVPLMRALAAEEVEHTRLCERLLEERGAPRGPNHGNPYVHALRQVAHAHGGGLLEQLIVAGTIEARSCERFRLLAERLRGTGSPLGGVYEDLFASEARHHATFVSLAIDLFGEARARRRLAEVMEAEAAIIAAQPWGPRIH